jgi:hypothetical protein
LVNYKREDAARGYEQAVDAKPETYAWSYWFVYPQYTIKEREGSTFIYAPMSAEQVYGRERYRSLSPAFADLFLRFARWPEEHDMDRNPLVTDKNEDAALEWAQAYGVLGVDSPDLTVLGASSEVTSFFLGRPGPDGFWDRGSRSEALGGPEETVERFAGEVWEANLVLRLYEAATNPEGPDVDTIVGYMPDDGEESMGLSSTRELHGETPKTASNWALDVVEEIVERKVRGRCWPIPVRDGSSHKEGWAFDSWLGVLWLQSLWLMLGQPRRCEWCGALLDVNPEQVEWLERRAVETSISEQRKSRTDRRFCPSRYGIKDKCKADYNYHRGTGTSSKEARKKKRDRQRGKSSPGFRKA